MSTFRKNIKLGTKDPLWGTEDIANKAITTPKIADGAVTAEKLGFPVASATEVNGLKQVVVGKVDKEEGKGLSTNDYTTSEKTKLGGIEAGAQKNAVNTVIDANYVHTDNNYSNADKAKVASAITQHQDISGKVDKVTGKGLSTNDYSNAEKGKVAQLEQKVGDIEYVLAVKTTTDISLEMTYIGSGSAKSNQISLKKGDVVNSITTTAETKTLQTSTGAALSVPYTASSDIDVYVMVSVLSSSDIPSVSINATKSSYDKANNQVTELTTNVTAMGVKVNGHTPTWQDLVDGLVIMAGSDGTEKFRLVERTYTDSGVTKTMLCIASSSSHCLGDIQKPSNMNSPAETLVLGNYFFHNASSQASGTLVSVKLNGKDATVSKTLPISYDYHSEDTQLHATLTFPKIGGVDDKAEKTSVGTLSELTTTDKSSLVAAVNEVKSGAHNLVVFNVTEASGVYSATIEGTMPSQADMKKTRFVAMIKGYITCELSASYTGSYYLAGIFLPYGQTNFSKIKITTSGSAISSVTVTNLDF